MTLIILIKQPVVEFFAGKHYFYHIVSEEVPLEIYFGGFRQCLSLWRRISTPRPITQKQKSVKVSSVNQHMGYSERTSRKQALLSLVVKGVVPPSLRAAYLPPRWLNWSSVLLAWGRSRFDSLSRHAQLLGIVTAPMPDNRPIKTNIPCHCGCGNLISPLLNCHEISPKFEALHR